ncbi:hypothetical protein HY285_03295 [Candidatus Peregrinibacteria bacterium]|nr:hypothetical protein [Candidatus Peregrinibacteria bacterium]MBI3816541.1 hypothetical protein [Candidatus Peregrinibacteria bacterium]
MLFFHPKKSPHAPGCMVLHMIVAALLALSALASLVGVYKAHFLNDGLTFGTSTASLALIAFAFTVTMWLHSMKSCMGKCEICNGGK